MYEVFEIAGLITGVVGVWLTIRRHILCFPVGIINVIISAWLFFGHKLYADVLQQLVYFALLAYGWYLWQRGRFSDGPPNASFLDFKGLLLLLLSIATCTLVLGALLDSYTDASLPWADSFATSTAFAAQFLIARRKTDNWILWMVVNICYIIIYLQKDLPLYAVLFSVYLFMAIAGFKAWLRSSSSSSAGS